MAYDRYGRERDYDRGYRRDYERSQDRYDRHRQDERNRGRAVYGREDEDRGFFDRASDEVRSWFGDEDAERRRMRDERQQREDERRYGRGGFARGAGYGGGYGWSGTGGADFGPYYGGVDQPHLYTPYGSPGGTLNHPRSSWNYGAEREEARGWAGSPIEGPAHDYRAWRDRELEAFDQDYNEYRRERQSAFEDDFGKWRETRQSQRQSLKQVREHMDVVGSDGEHVGTVDHVRGDHIKLTRTDKDAGGHHHRIPCAWVSTVDTKVTLNRSAADAKRAWQDAEERDDGNGPHVLNRSFAGTY